ncbi:fimbrial protein [Enterobacter sp. KBR-315C3_2022]|uniref:fimbrial protein n=1 Tax=Enterobacter sp. KBR-315C3_2022 TaxID=3242494 RepID=UPI0035270CB8
MKKLLMRLCLLLISGGAALSAQATVICKIYNDSSFNTTASLNGSAVLSVTPDIPVGTRLYAARVLADKYPDAFSINCNGQPKEAFSAILKTKVLNGSGLGDNITFDSGYPGIGVQFWIKGGYITADGQKAANIINSSTTESGNVILGANVFDREMTMFLVKTGDVQPGVLSATGFPYVQYIWNPGNNASFIPGILSEFHFNGQVSITTPSCKTPENVDVELGEYTTTEINNNGGSPWKDASIRLTGCPRFTGYAGKQGSWHVTQRGNSSISYAAGEAPVYAANKLGLTLNGVRGNLDNANGIVDIERSVGSASGVAVQIAKGDSGNNYPAQLGAETLQDIPMDGVSTITIPLVVRMIKHGESAVKAGRVNTQITYLINYK